MNTQISNSPASGNFGLLPEPRRRLSSFGASAGLNVALGVFLAWVASLHFQKQPPLPHYESTALVFATPPPPAAPLPPVPRMQPPSAPLPAVMAPPKIQLPKPLPEPPRPQTAHLENAPMPAIPAAAAKAVAAPPQPRTGLFDSPRTTPVANDRTAPTAQSGGFGNPAGAAVSSNASRAWQAAAVGSFAAAPGAGSGAAARGVVQGAGFSSGVADGAPGAQGRAPVASAGFSNAAGGGGAGQAHAKVASAGFGNALGSGGGSQPVKAQAASFVAPEVISEPRPQYTEEARQLKIQGEVTLQVKFGADGKVEVLKVVAPLGHGLDEQAERVAQQIRFKPAARNGQPVDLVTLIHILFQLA